MGPKTENTSEIMLGGNLYRGWSLRMSAPTSSQLDLAGAEAVLPRDVTEILLCRCSMKNHTLWSDHQYISYYKICILL